MIRQQNTSWDIRLAHALSRPLIPADVADGLADTLGALGCEAELANHLLTPYTDAALPDFQQATTWLHHLLHLVQRVVRLANELAILTQSLHRPQGMPESDPWWPPYTEPQGTDDALAYWLRAGGYAYRHTTTLRLSDHAESLHTTLAMVLHALQTLPPGGILNDAALLNGLDELNLALAGDLVPHHLDDLDSRHTGLLTAITSLLRLHAHGPSPLAHDILWAQGQLERAQVDAHQPALSSRAGGAPAPVDPWSAHIVQEWQATVNRLQAMR